jgi:carboxylesterase type B
LLGNNDNEAGYYKISAYGQGKILNDSAWDAFNLQDFTCATSLSARFRANHSVPTWRFRYFGDWDNLRLYPTSGAYHGSDLEMVFGASQDVSGLPESGPEMLTQDVIMRAWAAFAMDPEGGVESVIGWPVYDPDSMFSRIGSCGKKG